MDETGSEQTSLLILVVDDEPNIRKTLTISLEAEGHRVAAVSNSRDALMEARRRHFDLALIDLRLGAESGMELITALHASCPWMKSAVITAYASIDSAVEAMRRGAFDYLPKPFTHDQVALLVRKVVEVRTLEQKIEALQEVLRQAAPEADFTSGSPSMQHTLAMARQVAASEATILLRGESGTGKTILARAIHTWSPRASKPFGTVSCPSLSAELLESELFGHVKGAFTGAVRDTPGRIAACEGGTLLLDEIGDLPLSVQAKLLRVLQEKTYERVGGLETRKADLRIIAATNMDLESAMKAGRFREDLFYRLDVVEINIPPLRERREDILPLAERLLAFFAGQNHRRVLGFTEEAGEVLLRYRWPGNVRELRNAVERAVLLCNGERVGVECLQLRLGPGEPSLSLGDLVSLERIEEAHIRRVLAVTKSIEEACRVLDMDSVTLWRRRKKYGI
ncbi:sigma-54-dependent transcriptional regulator [Syntrophobacter fumaroxidans]|uniref:Two-component response regulator AlgB n=1 Tax=Syntrophobacter fumaroxidans (strain DSM 10017 / MPOB) TaxID=335543 RepID=A0LLJ8_SYNFM|nr:sigma-54 dependent transcriptional regulator [Syntrophobacter fumaroxidans]ABK18300.1 Two-component response regulator AlgB [Syntrophobacter fumaroxidans MPOB]